MTQIINNSKHKGHHKEEPNHILV